MRRGFTLIELLVVISIIGILSSVVLASLNSARAKSRDARRVADLSQIRLALELYFDSARTYPSALADLVNAGAIPQVPRDPLLGTGTCRPGYCYAAVAPTVTYHLGAQLEDPNHPTLNVDKDCNSTGATDLCPTGAITGGFLGKGTGTNGDNPTTPVYDLIP